MHSLSCYRQCPGLPINVLMSYFCTKRCTVFRGVLEVRETENNPLSLKLKQEWLIHVHRTKQSAQTKTLSAFLISVFWLSLVIDTKSSPELKLHEIVRPKKLNISPGRGTENNQTERYGKEVSRVSPSSEDRNEGLWVVV